MPQINSRSRQPSSFRAKDGMASMAITLTDYTPDASWRLRIEAEIEGGGRFVLGAVDTVQPAFLRIRNPNRIVAVVSIPGIRNWYIYSELLRGTPPAGKSEVYADLEMTKTEEYAAGCCPLVALPGVSINVNENGDQSPNGPPPVGPRLTLFTGPGFALSADIAYLGMGDPGEFVQLHDAGAGDPVSSASMIGIGFPVSPTINQTILLDWSGDRRRRRFFKGYTFALSTTQVTFTVSGSDISAWGEWDLT